MTGFSFDFGSWRGSNIQLIRACKDFLASGRKHKGAKMRIIDGYYCIRNWNHVSRRMEWHAITETPARMIAEKRGNLGKY